MDKESSHSRPQSACSFALKQAYALSLLVLVLAAIASAGGLFLEDLYRDTAWVIPQNRGQDLVTLCLALPALALSLPAAKRGSARGKLIWLGLIGYVFYTYTGAAFAYSLNRFFLLYVALFSLSLFTLVSAAANLDVEALKAAFGPSTPRKAARGFLISIGVMLLMLWLGQLLPFLLHGEPPDGVKRAGNGMIFVYVLDLGLVVPTALLGARWLAREFAWGYVLAGFIMIKATAMGFALLGMTWFAHRAGQLNDVRLALPWLLIAFGGLAMTSWFLSACRRTVTVDGPATNECVYRKN